MANIGTTTAFYKVETSLSRANNEVSKSMERLATGKQNANAGDRSAYVAMADTFRLDYVGTKAGIKGASVAMGYLETGMRVLDSASQLLSRLQELAVLGANNTNTVQDNEAINLEAEALADEFNRLMSTSTYKGKNIFVDAAGDQEIALGGRGSEMNFGIATVGYSALYSSSERTVAGEPNNAETFNLMHLPSDAIVAKSYGAAVSSNNAESGTVTLGAGKKYVVRGVETGDEVSLNDQNNAPSTYAIRTALDASELAITTSAGATVANTGSLASGNVIDVTTATTVSQTNGSGALLTVDTDTDVTGELTLATTTTFTFTNGTDTERTAGTYSDVTFAAANGTGTGNGGTTATLDVTVDAAGVTTIALVDGGSGYQAGNTLTIDATQIGGTAGDTDIVITLIATEVTAVADRDASSTFTIGADDYTTDGSGTGATFTITTNGSGVPNVTVTNGGSGYAVDDTITIQGVKFSSSDEPADFTFDVASIADTTGTSVKYAEVLTSENAFKSGETYVIQSMGDSNGVTSTADSDAFIIAQAFTDTSDAQLTGTLAVGTKIKMASVGDTIGSTTVTQEHLDAANALIENMTFTMSTDSLTSDIESIQALIARARVEAGSQYAAIESAVSYTTDLTAQYELGYNIVHDVNFSAETAHLAKNQILQQAATAMLAQANSGQQGLLQLIQG